MKAKEVKAGYPLYYIDGSEIFFGKGAYITSILECANGHIIFYLNGSNENWIQTISDNTVYLTMDEYNFYKLDKNTGKYFSKIDMILLNIRAFLYRITNKIKNIFKI